MQGILLKISKADSTISENRLKSIRNAHNKKNGGQAQQHTGRMEDYLEVIYELIRQKGYATAIDISESLSVSSPSITKMLKKLDENKYLHYEKYRGISLGSFSSYQYSNLFSKSLFLIKPQLRL
jgi:Fic family protein